MIFNMGCGYQKLDGFQNVDVAEKCAPDEVVDLEATPWPWPDNCADEVLFNHSLEHLGQTPKVFLAIMTELYRICRHDALVRINVPHIRHDNFWNDPTHVRPISPQLFRLFSKRENDAAIRQGASDTPLAHYLNVDFELLSAESVLEEPYSSQAQAGRMTIEELQLAARTQNNVIVEFKIQIKAVKN